MNHSEADLNYEGCEKDLELLASVGITTCFDFRMMDLDTHANNFLNSYPRLKHPPGGTNSNHVTDSIPGCHNSLVIVQPEAISRKQIRSTCQTETNDDELLLIADKLISDATAMLAQAQALRACITKRKRKQGLLDAA